jgi:Icc-related predicted phosphoesterase
LEKYQKHDLWAEQPNAEFMRLVFISDTHNQHDQLRLPDGDFLIHAGDFSGRGRPEEVAAFMRWFSQQPHRHKICIAGNHDFMAERDPKAFRALIPDHVVYLEDSGVTLEGLRFWGSPITPWFFDWAFNRHRGAEIRPHWALIPKDTDILITHGPPYRILDVLAHDGRPVGCLDLLETVTTIKPKVHVFGHIHEAYGQLEQDGTAYLNASVLDENYVLKNRPIELVV